MYNTGLKEEGQHLKTESSGAQLVMDYIYLLMLVCKLVETFLFFVSCRRNKHGVPQQKIAQMMDRFSFPISVDIVMSSQEPLHVNQRRRPEHSQMIRKKQGLQPFTEN